MCKTFSLSVVISAQMNELGRVIYNSANVVHGGIVCFFPSYEYERVVYTHWEEAGFLQKIGARKKASTLGR